MERRSYDGQNVVVELDDPNTLLRYYVHGPTYVDERLLLHDAAEDKDYYYTLQPLYTVAGLVNERGVPVEPYTYDAYGKVNMFDVGFHGDGDFDGDLDTNDFALLAACYTGSRRATSVKVRPMWERPRW